MASIFYLPQNAMFQFMIAFILVFGVVYSALSVTKFASNRNVNALIALAFALFATLNPNLSAFLWNVMPYAAILIVVLFVLRFFVDILEKGRESGGGQESNDFIGIAVLFAALIALALFHSSGMFRMADPELVENVMWATGVLIVIVIIIKSISKQ